MHWSAPGWVRIKASTNTTECPRSLVQFSWYTPSSVYADHGKSTIYKWTRAPGHAVLVHY